MPDNTGSGKRRNGAVRVAILSVPTGQGHNQAALSVEAYLKQTDADVECRIVDVVENVNRALAGSVQRGYLISTMMTPKVYGKFYDFADKRDESKYSSFGRIIKTVLNKKLMRFIKDYRPDIVVATHVFAAIALTYLKRKYPFKAKTVAIVTDFTIHPFWEDVDLDYYVTASELLNYQAFKKGYELSKVKPFGIPIMPKFSVKIPQAEARAAAGIDEKFTVLVMMGSMGYGEDVGNLVKSLDRLDEDLQIVVVCGNNKKLKRHIEKLTLRHNIYCLGFVNNVDVLMDAADCMVTKPGGLSTSEALAKLIPIIMLDPIPGQEDRNREFMLNNGLALNLSSSFGIEEAIYQLMKFDYRAENLRRNMEYVRKPDSAKALGDFLLSLGGRVK